MDLSDQSFENLCQWMSSLTNTNTILTTEELSSGRPFVKALRSLDPEYFTDSWLKKIDDESHIDSVSSNWRLKVLTLKKILKTMIDYYLAAAQKVLPESNQPDLNFIARDLDKKELVKLLQVIVLIAINCPLRTSIIANISTFDESVQSSIMMAIQGDEDEKREPEHLSDLALDQIHGFQEELKQLHDQILALSHSNEEYERKCLDFEIQIAQLSEEKRTLIDEKSHLEHAVKNRCFTNDDNDSYTKKISTLQKRLEDAEEELFKVEHAKDEYKVKAENLARENKELVSKIDMSAGKDEFQKVRDELEELRLKTAEFKKMEAILETYKRKLDESSQLRNEMKVLQDKNNVFMNSAIELEEEKRRTSVFKTQLESQKRQLQEYEAKFNEYSSQNEHLKSENERFKSEWQNLLSERKRATTEMMSMKDLKHEMQLLEGNEKNTKDQVIDCLESRLQTKDLELMTTEEKFKTALHAKDMELRILDERCKTLQTTKDQEMKALEDKYQGYLAKAKAVIVELESSQINNNNGIACSKVEFETLRKEIEDKEEMVHKLEEDHERMRIMREQEERLITTAFHEMAMQMHRDASENRILSQIGQTPSSFLDRQRQITGVKFETQSNRSSPVPNSNVSKNKFAFKR